MEIRELSPEVFEQHQLDYDNANFVQSRQMYEVHRQRNRYEDAFFVGFFEGERLVGQALVLVRRRMRWFKEAVLFQGPLFNGHDATQFAAMVTALEEYLKQRGIARVEMTPYLMTTILNENLEVLEEHRYQELIDTYSNLGYQRLVDYDSGVNIQQIFRKPLCHCERVEDIFDSFPRNTKRMLKKEAEAHLVVRELTRDDIPIFYNILHDTAVRKGFQIQDISYFELLKRYFGDDLKMMVAFLDVEGYSRYCEERIRYFEEKLLELRQRGNSVKTPGLLTEATNQLEGFKKRRDRVRTVDCHLKLLPLSGYLFIGYGSEYTSIFAGNYEEYMNFGGPTILNWHLIQFAKEAGYDYYNFYGTMETAEAENRDGNFNFKRQFGGQLERMMGTFSKNLNPLLEIAMIIKSKLK